MTTYSELYRQSIADPDSFWAKAAEELHWYKKWDQVLDLEVKPVARWFKGAKLNTCYNAVDRHVESGRGEQAAIIYDSPLTGQQRKISYSELQQQVASFAGALIKHGANYLHAHDSRSGYCHAGLCSNRCNSFSGFRWFCGQRTRDAHR